MSIPLDSSFLFFLSLLSLSSLSSCLSSSLLHFFQFFLISFCLSYSSPLTLTLTLIFLFFSPSIFTLYAFNSYFSTIRSVLRLQYLPFNLFLFTFIGCLRFLHSSLFVVSPLSFFILSFVQFFHSFDLIFHLTFIDAFFAFSFFLPARHHAHLFASIQFLSTLTNSTSYLPLVLLACIILNVCS
ncbi:MAG: hypothetical protein JOS17DRAFT_134086 [Linnemannia elongata]|nr:MAG: hypothetical protein JOS17DRAFT_134086 [Linnemannia elongata]